MMCRLQDAQVANHQRAVRYGERQRPEHRSVGLLTDAQVADAPRTVPPDAARLPPKDFRFDTLKGRRSLYENEAQLEGVVLLIR